MKRYFLYVKWPGQSKYRPVNWRTGQQEVNLIKASIFKPEELAALETELNRPENEGIQYKFKEVK